MNEILFVTSSTKKMYDFSGKDLINSFIKHQKDDIVYYTENFMLPKDIIKYKQIIERNIENDYYLISWLKKFSSYIPIQFGGQYDYTKDDNAYDNFLTPTKTKDWNYKCSLWFRKIVALYNSSIYLGKKYKYIIWIDNDCKILKNINIDIITNLFNNKEVFYFMGNKRKEIDFGIESGFIGFKKKNNKFQIIEEIYNYYFNGNFLNHKRWDDGYILKFIFNNDDIYNDVSKNSNKINVIENEKIIDYIFHNKGEHWKNDIDYIINNNNNDVQNKELNIVNKINKFHELIKEIEKERINREIKLMTIEDNNSKQLCSKYSRHLLICNFFLELSKKEPYFKIYKKIIDLLINNKLQEKNLKKYIFDYLDNQIRLKFKYNRDINTSYRTIINKNIYDNNNNLNKNFNIYNIKYDKDININIKKNNKIIKIMDNFLYLNEMKIRFSSKIFLIEYLLGYYPINNIPNYILSKLEIYIIGKGPSLKSIIKREHDNQIIVAINDAANICQDLDFICINDEYNFDMLKKDTLKNIKNIIMLTNPHINTVLKDKSIRQGPVKEYSYIDLYNKLIKLKCSAKIHLCSIHTSYIKENNIVDIGKVYSSGDTAISFFIKNGFKNIKTVGIGNDIGYSKLTNRLISKSKVIKNTNEKEWYTENFNVIINKFKNNNINYHIT
jgi:hypothetical protein